jgi:hypothetical protein
MRSLATFALLVFGGCSFMLDFDESLFDAGPDARPVPDARAPRPDAAVDSYEPNETLGTAKTLTPGTYELSITPVGDNDYFGFSLSTMHNVTIDCLFLERDGDLDLRLYDNAGTLLQTSAGWVDNEQIVRTAVAAGTYYIQVYAFDNRFENVYTLVLTVD